MNQVSSKTPRLQPEIFEAEKGLMTLRYEQGMSVESILDAFGVSTANWSEAGREMIVRNKFKIVEGVLAKEDGRPIASRTLVYMPKRFVSKKTAVSTDSPKEILVTAKNTVPAKNASQGVMSAYKTEFQNLMADKTARTAIYAGAVLSVVIGISAAVGISLTAPKHAKKAPPPVAEMAEDDEDGGEEEQPTSKIAKASSPSPSIPTVAPVSQKAKGVHSAEFVFTSNSKASNLKAAIDEFNAMDKKRQQQ